MSTNFEPPKNHQPVRGSDVELWIKMRRDGIRDRTPLGMYMKGWNALNDLLDEYRLAADTGRSLLEMDKDDDEI